MAEPMATGTFTRRQAPEGEVSSSLAEEVWRVPNWSSQETSTTAIMAVLGSVLIVLILVSLYRQELEVVQGWFSVLLGGSDRQVRCRMDAWLRYCRIEKRNARPSVPLGRVPSIVKRVPRGHWEAYGCAELAWGVRLQVRDGRADGGFA